MPLLHGYRMENHRRPQPVEELPLPETLYIPLPGAEESYARIVPEGKEVAKGQVLSAPKYAAVAHAPAPGVMESVEFRHIPSCGNVWAAKLRVGGSRAIQPRPAQGQNRDERILRAAADAGIVDEMTGRPLYQELYRLRRREVSLLLACGIEDDPWCSSALSVLAEAPEDVAEGLRLAAAFCGAEETGVAVCPENVRETRERFPSMRIEIAKERYPARAFLLRRLRPAGGRFPRLCGACLPGTGRHGSRSAHPAARTLHHGPYAHAETAPHGLHRLRPLRARLPAGDPAVADP